MLATLAHGAAARTHDRALEVAAEVSIARAQRSEQACRRAYADAKQLGDAQTLDKAEDCLVETLVNEGKYADVAELIEHKITETTAQFGADAPQLGDYLEVKSDIAVRQNKLADARAAAERSLAIRRKDFGPEHFNVAKSIQQLAQVADAEGDNGKARQLYEQALAMTDETMPQQVASIVGIRIDLAMDSARRGDRDAAYVHFDKSVALLRKSGNDSRDLAVVLVNYGQVKADDDIAAGLAMLAEARAIFLRHHDRRAFAALGALLVVTNRNGRYADELAYAEQALREVDANTSRRELALLNEALGDALVGTHGDRERARKAMQTARDLYAKLGPSAAKAVARVDRWLAKH
jgi:tetratricopeptide (TPR) repeat protein